MDPVSLIFARLSRRRSRLVSLCLGQMEREQKDTRRSPSVRSSGCSIRSTGGAEDFGEPESICLKDTRRVPSVARQDLASGAVVYRVGQIVARRDRSVPKSLEYPDWIRVQITILDQVLGAGRIHAVMASEGNSGGFFEAFASFSRCNPSLSDLVSPGSEKGSLVVVQPAALSAFRARS